MDRSRRGSPAANPLRVPSSGEEVHSDDEIFREIEDFEMEEEQVQVGDSPLYVHTSNVLWSRGASSSLRVEPSTSGALVADPNLQYICEDWFFGLSNKKLGFISR